jgi:hypothetical protein
MDRYLYILTDDAEISAVKIMTEPEAAEENSNDGSDGTWTWVKASELPCSTEFFI